MMKWNGAQVFEFVSPDLERHVLVVASSLDQAAEMCGLSPDQQVGYNVCELIISEKAFAERNCPDDESDLI